jgi:hypothetical protein
VTPAAVRRAWSRGEIVGVEEEGDSAAGLVADRGGLFGGGGAGEEDGGSVRGCVGWEDGDPPFGRDPVGIAGAFVLLGNGRVLDQIEASLPT